MHIPGPHRDLQALSPHFTIIPGDMYAHANLRSSVVEDTLNMTAYYGVCQSMWQYKQSTCAPLTA